MNIVYYSSKTKNTHRFVEKMGLPAISIGRDTIVVDEYILFSPTYATQNGQHLVPPMVIRFLNNEGNRSLIRGVVGFGNRNFGTTFAIAADIISQKCNVPIVHKVELFGIKEDVETIKEYLTKERNVNPIK